jgi:peptide-methionine (S)-S-oxide reductase
MDERETIVLGGGCFWCTEAVFDRVRGVLDVESGYCNGQVERPTYEAVCTGRTGHAEVVRLVFDPQVVDLRTLLEIFFATHDPTTLNRQGHDVGTQYRSGIYWTEPEQASVARQLLDDWPAVVPRFVKVFPHEYRRALSEIAQRQGAGKQEQTSKSEKVAV